MKILIAGFGSIGRRHFRNLLDLGIEDFVFLRSKRSTLPDDEIAAYPVETEIQDALAHQPQAVIVSNPTALHLDVSIPAAQAGCHIFLEKPISHNMDRIAEFREALNTGDGKVLVGFQFRYHPGLKKIADLLGKSAIGRPLSVRAHWGEYLPDWHPWEDYRQGYSARKDLGGGVILTITHPLDYLRRLLGDVSAVWALTASDGDLGLQVEDNAEIGLRFTSGVLGTVHLDYNQRPPSHRLEIIGTQGTIRWDNADGIVCHYSAESNKWEEHLPPEGFERNDLFRAQMKHFLNVALNNVYPICTLNDGIAALELALAAHESNRLGIVIHRETTINLGG